MPSLVIPLAALLVVLPSGPLSGSIAGSLGEFGDDEAPIEVTRATLERWVDTRRLISEEKRDWAEGRALLEDRVALVKREIETLRTKIDEARGTVGESDKKRVELQSEVEGLRTTSEALLATIVELETRAKALLPRLPAPLQERVSITSQRIPADPSDTKVSLSERFLNVLAILNESDKFNREVKLALEVRELPDGSSMEVSTLYVGVGQAYYASAKGSAAGYGTPTADGWSWTPADDAAPAILAAIAVFQNEKPAAFVSLPLIVDAAERSAR